MPQDLFQLENNEVTICKNNKVYQDTFENFSKDCANDFIEKKINQVIYNQTLGVNVINGELQDEKINSIFDKIIADIDIILQSQQNRQPKQSSDANATQ